jgi:uncharacterized protein YacL
VLGFSLREIVEKIARGRSCGRGVGTSIKMWLYALSWVAMVIQICFVTLSIVAGLYYMAELVEEYTVMTAKIIRYTILSTTLVLLGFLVFEDLPLMLVGCCLASNLMYYLMMQTFPFTQLMSPSFILSIVLLVVNHYMAFSFFSSVWYPFSEVLAFFTVCLWLVPFALFVSLSANENVLPTSVMPEVKSETDGDIVSNYFRRKGKRYGLLSFLKSAQDTILPQRVKKGF